MSYRPSLPHFAYFRALADTPDDDLSPRYRNAMAGLVALQLIDCWARGQPLPTAGLEAFQDALHMTSAEAAERRSLATLAVALRAESAGRDYRSASVLTLLDDYAEVVWQSGETRLAIDSCRTLIRHARTLEERAILPRTHSRLAICLGNGERWQAALEVLQKGRLDAYTRADTAGDLMLRTAEAELEAARGNVVAAEAILDDIATEASLVSAKCVRARALHGRGRIAHRRGDRIRALSLYAIAIQEYNDDASLDRALMEMAAIWLETGYTEVASRIFLALEASGVEPLTRTNAKTGLAQTRAHSAGEFCVDSARDEMQPILRGALNATERVTARQAPSGRGDELS